MLHVLFIILYLCFAALLFHVFMLFRIRWVYKERVNLLNSNFTAYKRLPSFDVMVRKIWVWDIKKFLKGE